MAHPKESTGVADFGKDHWSLLAYVEHCCVEGAGGTGRLAHAKMRCNEAAHPLQVSGHARWRLNYSTRLQGFFDFPERADSEKAIAAGLMLRDHDDWDCLDDLQASGYVEILSDAQGAVRMTPVGNEVAARLRAHKTNGGQFAGFRLEAEATA